MRETILYMVIRNCENGKMIHDHDVWLSVSPMLRYCVVMLQVRVAAAAEATVTATAAAAVLGTPMTVSTKPLRL